MSKLNYFRVPQFRERWTARKLDLAFAALLLAAACAAFSTLAKWHFQRMHARTLLDYLPSTAGYRLLIEHIPGTTCMLGLGVLVLCSIRRFVKFPRAEILLTDFAAYFVAFWLMIFVVAGNSFEAFN